MVNFIFVGSDFVFDWMASKARFALASGKGIAMEKKDGWSEVSGYSVAEKGVDFDKALQIDSHDLNEEFIKQPSLTWYYGCLEIEAQEAYDDAKTDYKVIFAKAMEEKRQRYELSGRALPQKTLEGLALQDAKVIQAEKRVREARKNKRYASLAFEAISRQRMSSLISVAANYRTQMADAEPRLNDVPTPRNGARRISTAQKFGKTS